MFIIVVCFANSTVAKVETASAELTSDIITRICRHYKSQSSKVYAVCTL
jgi:hypothetical protein